MKLEERAKIEVYYLLFFWATKELLLQNKEAKASGKESAIFTDEEFIKKIDFNNRFLILKKQRNSKNLKKLTYRLLKRIQEYSVSMELLSFEMLIFITMDYLVSVL